MEDVPSVTSPEKPPSLPDEWVDRIFDVMENRYLAKWFDSFGSVPKARVKARWAHEPADFTPQGIRRGLGADKPEEDLLAPRNFGWDGVGLIQQGQSVCLAESAQWAKALCGTGGVNGGFDIADLI